MTMAMPLRTGIPRNQATTAMTRPAGDRGLDGTCRPERRTRVLGQLLEREMDAAVARVVQDEVVFRGEAVDRVERIGRRGGGQRDPDHARRRVGRRPQPDRRLARAWQRIRRCPELRVVLGELQVEPADIAARLERTRGRVAAGRVPLLEQGLDRVGVQVAGRLPGVEVEGHGRILPRHSPSARRGSRREPGLPEPGPRPSLRQ